MIIYYLAAATTGYQMYILKMTVCSCLFLKRTCCIRLSVLVRTRTVSSCVYLSKDKLQIVVYFHVLKRTVISLNRELTGTAGFWH